MTCARTRRTRRASEAGELADPYEADVMAVVHLEGIAVGALIMLGTLFGLIVLIFALVLRYDPEARARARSPSKSRESKHV